MILLPNGCSCSTPNVFPKNWKTVKASTKNNWYISYRFKDPTALDKYPAGKQQQIKGMNVFKNLKERQQVTATLLENEMNNLINKGYNPITGGCMIIDEIIYEIEPNTPFIKALYKALEKIITCPANKLNFRSVIKYAEMSAKQLRIEKVPISDIRRKHIKILLEHLRKIKDIWSAYTFNFYRKSLSRLFDELLEYEAIEFNPVKDIKKQKHTHKTRVLLTNDEREKVDTHLKTKYYNFWRFLHIFFHSGSRETELMLLKGSDIDLKNQRYKIVIKKGKECKETWKPIKDVAMPFWEEIMKDCLPGQYLFSRNLKPGGLSISSSQITRRWRRHVKDKLKIKADFYSLKHLNLDETAKILSIQDAAKMAGHTSTVITMKHYVQGEKERQDERLKKVNNAFS